ncbi:hypothetical protein FQA39_LY06415 [Lamprigera yunnana]|nr:hypothetical protein FQA39_LY06415 [Lamprigera yunnana]
MEEGGTRIENKIVGMQAEIALKKENESTEMGNQELRDIIKQQRERIEDRKKVRGKNLVIQGIKEEAQENEAIMPGEKISKKCIENENQERAKMDSRKGRTTSQRSPEGEEEKNVKYSRLEGDQERQPINSKNC